MDRHHLSTGSKPMKTGIAVCALLVAACASDVGAATEALTGVDPGRLAGSDGVWTYNEVSGTQCRDGSTAGVSTNLRQYSKKLVIYLEGGGWCGDAFNCSWNNASARDWASLLGTFVGVGGMFDRRDGRNPL